MEDLKNWIEEIEAERLRILKDDIQTSECLIQEAKAYYDSFRSYSFEEMRDYGHTWGPGYEPEKEEVLLPECYKVTRHQLIILTKLIESGKITDDEIRYLFLSKNGFDDEYAVCKTPVPSYEDVLLQLIEFWRNTAEFYMKKE